MDFERMALAADTARVQAGGRSIFEKLADAGTKGLAGSVLSGWESIYNTGVWAVNSVFDAKAEEMSTAKTLGDFDRDWRKYYEENKQTIDTVGFIGGAFIPGGLAVKGLNAARAGTGAGAFRGVMGYTMRKQEEYLTKGLQQIASEGADIFSTLNANKLKSIGFGFADNVLQTAVFESAAAVAMQRSPTFDGESWSDMSWDILKTSLVGGTIGGAVEGLWTNKIFRNVGKLVDSKSRAYDTVVQIDKAGLGLGDKAFSIIDDALKLPKEVFESDRVLDFTYKINGRDVPIKLNTEALYDKKLAATVSKAEQTMQANLTNALADDPTVGAVLGKAMLDVIQQGKAAQKSDGVIREELLTTLGNLQRIQSLGGSRTDFTKDVFYLVPEANLVDASLPDAQQLFSQSRYSSADKGYRVVGDPAAAKSGLVGTPGVGNTVQEAFEKGYDIVLSGEKGKIHVNPKSQIYRAVQDNEDEFLRTTMNTRTLQTSDTPVPAIADMAKDGAPSVNANGVTAGNYTFQFSTANFTSTLSSLKNTARHLWAGEVKSLKGSTIDSRDFSLLDRVIADPSLVDASTRIKLPDGSFTQLPVGRYREWVLEQKVAALQDMLPAGQAAPDHRLLSYALNTEQKWVQDAISHEFDPTKLNNKEAFRALESYAARDNIVLVYKKPPSADPNNAEFATGMLGYEYRKKMGEEAAQTAAATVFGKATQRFLDIVPAALRGKFDGTNTGPSFLGFSNADYGDKARLWAQDVGRATHLTQQEFREAALNVMQPHMAKVIADGNTEVGVILNRIRFSEDRMSLLDGHLVTLADAQRWTKLKAAVDEGTANPQDLQNFAFKYRYKLQEDTYKFFDSYHQTHKTWLEKHNTLAASRGRTNEWSPDALYVPPINTQKVPYFAFVRAKEGRVFSSTETAMITAKSPEELKGLIAKIENQYDDLQVILKDDSELYYKARGDYEFSKGLNEPKLDPMLRKQGHLGDFVPVLEPKAVVEDFIQYVGRREDELVRNAVQVNYGQIFTELDWLSKEATKVEKSKFGFLGKLEAKKINDPFGDYQRLALNISKRAEYRLWNELNEFVDAMGTRAYGLVESAYKSAHSGKSTWEDANKQLNAVGLRGVFESQADYLAAQTGADRSLVKLAVAKGNTLLANIALRLDTANALVNVVSTPILLGAEVSAIRHSIKNDPELAAKFQSMLQVGVPGGGTMPSTIGLLFNAVKNYFGKDKLALIRRYEDDIGSIRSDAGIFHEMLADMALTPNIAPAAWSKNVDKWMEKGASLTGNNSAEQFTRFVASDVMRQLTEDAVKAGKMSVKEQNAFVSIFVNRTQGNYISSQRPIIFQGVVGSAIGLFQTYQFNLFQQLFRHIENKDTRTIAIASALQSTIFGLNGLPMFDAINTHLIGTANINEGHRDIYSSVTAADKEWGEFALYGMSAFPLFSDKFPALYTRGDLNPRHVTIVPTSFQSIPVVEAATRLVGAVWGIGNQVANGGDFGSAMLHGLEHNGISRPLAGLAQIAKGGATTSKGSMISANQDLISVSTGARLLGAKPMDEAVALNHMFRQRAYQAADKERIERLGVAIKDKIRNGTMAEEDVLDFMGRYAAVGGRAESYGRSMQRWTKDANTSVVNTLMNAHKSVYGQRMFEVMGGDPLEDLTNQPAE